MNTNVWIAPREYNGEKTIWEWHFMTDQWVSQEINAVNTNEPVLLTITSTNANNQEVYYFTKSLLINIFCINLFV
jgi:hypothetical protein